MHLLLCYFDKEGNVCKIKKNTKNALRQTPRFETTDRKSAWLIQQVAKQVKILSVIFEGSVWFE